MGLEDDFCDIIKKARMGLGQSLDTLAAGTGISLQDLRDLEKGARLPTSVEITALAETLVLRSQPLSDIVLDGWIPNPPPSWMEASSLVRTVIGDIGGYAVKGYILADKDSGEAAMIDTGYDAATMLATLDRHHLTLRAICLTHGHADHAGGLDRILRERPVPVYLGSDDYALLPWKPPRDHLAVPTDGQAIPIGRLTLQCLATPGHTPGGYCYQVQWDDGELCFVGDTLFAGSIGRSNPFSLYPAHLQSVRGTVLQLPEDTILLPGHGPATTVHEERRHNPFG